MHMIKSSKNQKPSKLKLNQETVRIVGAGQMAGVVGGVPTTSWGSDPGGPVSRVGCCEK